MPNTYEGLRVVTAAEMAEIDRRTIREFGIPAIELMENAGKSVAQEALRFLQELRKDPTNAEVVVLCGRGNNGGDGLVVARYLTEIGSKVSIVIIPPKPRSDYRPEVFANLRRAEAAGIPCLQFVQDRKDFENQLASADLLIDAVLGTGSSGSPAGEAQAMISAMAQSKRPTIAIDIPSGLDPDTGAPADPCVKAALTLTLGLPKCGLLFEGAKPYVGKLKVLDIGFPKELLR